MANVFGEAITDATLRRMPEYRGRQITKHDRVQVAMLHKNAGSKSEDVKGYVEGLSRQRGNGVSALGLIYNATGDTITLVNPHDWSGEVAVPEGYPSRIENGQWGGFLHVKTANAISSSNAAVVYRCKKETGEQDWMVAWDNPWNKMPYDSKVLTQIRDVGYFDRSWNIINTQMMQLGDHPNDQDDANGCKSTVTMSDCTFPSEGCKYLCAVLSIAP